MTRTISGVIEGHTTVTDELILSGMARGHITVADGGLLILGGMATDGLTIEAGGRAVIGGVVHGRLECAGEADFSGVVHGSIEPVGDGVILVAEGAHHYGSNGRGELMGAGGAWGPITKGSGHVIDESTPRWPITASS